ncbi:MULTISPECIES: Crp/Fnr family transcriptional regulator [Rhizobium]|nr:MULTISPECIES: Crp/Fnr family transcriptional regulator [Rhizobium]RKE80261.1 CRP-like cAMP-binding protein [Rhizobium sp. AG855]
MHHVSPFMRRVAQLLPSSGRSSPILDSVGFRSTCLEKGSEILGAGTSVRHVLTIGHGLAMRYRLLPDGSRQVIMFLTAGDICNPHIYPTVIDHGIAAVTPVRIDRFDCESLIGLSNSVVGLNQALWTLAEEQNAIMRNHITSLGRGDARARVIMLLKELSLRLSAAAGQVGPVFIPVTQSLLADAIGVTHIHFNRIIGDMGRRGVIATSRGGILVNSISMLEKLGEDLIVAA